MLVDWPSTYMFVLILLSQFLPNQASGCSPVAHLHVHGLEEEKNLLFLNK